MNTLIATKRSKTTKASDVRNSGDIPAVVYGAQIENTSISIPSTDFKKKWKEAGESNTIILELDKKKIDVLIHDVQRDPVRSHPVHVDFLAIDMSKPVTVEIPLEFINEAPAEKNDLGILLKVLYQIEIEALPKDLPQNIKVDLSTLETIGDQILVKNLKVPNGVTILTDEDEVIASITAIKEEEEEEKEEESIDLSEIEVEKKGKQEEPEETTEE
ncbi:MAG: 50S ribosomal protein L25 [Patescibacteria group bacterium]|nr:50S ribosomal protein L25 [Patescibacteria group bacterium]